MQVVAQLSMQDLPGDVRVLSLRASEALSEPFEVSVRFVCGDPGLPVKDWLWTEAAVQLQDADGSGSRVFHGIVEAASYAGKVEELHVHRVELRPRLHGLRTVLGDGPEALAPIDGEASVHPLCEWRAPPAGPWSRGSLSGRETR